MHCANCIVNFLLSYLKVLELILFPDNPAFHDGSLQRQDPMPPDRTQYEFARYGYPDRKEPLDSRGLLRGQTLPRTTSTTPDASLRVPSSKRIPHQNPQTKQVRPRFGQGDTSQEEKRIPTAAEIRLSAGGSYIVNRRYSAGARYGESSKAHEGLAMESLLSRLPSQQLGKYPVYTP
jgi:hypothetical protein